MSDPIAYLCASNCIYEIDSYDSLIGRNSECDIVITTSASISQKHAATLRDLNTKNGTFVNSEYIHDCECALDEKDLIRFGYDKTTYIFIFPPLEKFYKLKQEAAESVEIKKDNSNDKAAGIKSNHSKKFSFVDSLDEPLNNNNRSRSNSESSSSRSLSNSRSNSRKKTRSKSTKKESKESNNKANIDVDEIKKLNKELNDLKKKLITRKSSPSHSNLVNRIKDIERILGVEDYSFNPSELDEYFIPTAFDNNDKNKNKDVLPVYKRGPHKQVEYNSELLSLKNMVNDIKENVDELANYIMPDEGEEEKDKKVKEEKEKEEEKERENKIDMIMKQLSEMSNKIEQFNNEKEQLKQDADINSNEMNERITELTTQNKGLLDDIYNKDQSIKELNEKIKMLENEIDEINKNKMNEISKLKEESENKEKELNENILHLNEELIEKDKNISELNIKITSLQSTSSDINQLQEELQKKEILINELNSKIDKCSNDLNEKENSLTEISKKIETINEENNQLNIQIQDKDKMIENLQNQLKEKSENDDDTKILVELNKELSGKEEKIREQTTEINTLKQQIKTLNDELTKIKQNNKNNKDEDEDEPPPQLFNQFFIPTGGDESLPPSSFNQFSIPTSGDESLPPPQEPNYDDFFRENNYKTLTKKSKKSKKSNINNDNNPPEVLNSFTVPTLTGDESLPPPVNKTTTTDSNSNQANTTINRVTKPTVSSGDNKEEAKKLLLTRRQNEIVERLKDKNKDELIDELCLLENNDWSRTILNQRKQIKEMNELLEKNGIKSSFTAGKTEFKKLDPTLNSKVKELEKSLLIANTKNQNYEKLISMQNATKTRSANRQ